MDISVLPDTPTPRRRSPRLGKGSFAEIGFLAFSGPPRHSEASPGHSELRLGVHVSFVLVSLFQ